MLRLPQVYTILPGIPFAKALATQLWQEYKHDLSALSDVEIYLPNRRSVRAMADMFLQVSDGQATLLPRLTPLGDIDEEDLLEDDPFILQEDPFLTPAIPSLDRQIILTRMIMARPDIQTNATEAFALAGELARLLDRAHTEQVDLQQLRGLVTGDLAAHWEKTKEFLSIITEHWPTILKAQNQSDPAERRNVIFEKKIEALRRNPPQHRVIAAGSTGSIPATSRLLDMISRLPNGCVVLPGLDPKIDDVLWDAIDETHPYAYQKRLVELMEIDRHSIEYWPGQEIDAVQQEKLKLIHHALQPKDIFDLSNAVINPALLDGLNFTTAESPLHEARIIALHLRQSLDTPNQTIMVVTPDRVLAQYIRQEMRRWNIDVNDSAGTGLDMTPIGQFLKLIAGFSETSTPETHLLSIMRHGYFRLHPPVEKREADIHVLETALRKVFLPAGGLFGFSENYDSPLLKDTLAILKPLCVTETQPLQAWLESHIQTAEQLATTPNFAGAEILWRYEDGESAAQLLYKLHESARNYPIEMNARDYAAFIASTLSQVIVRPRYGTHPRIRILSPIEARLQHADRIILAGLNEGVWPATVKSDTWLSRPMLQEMGFGSPDRRLGQSALDFQLLFCALHILMTWSKKRDGVLAHPSRWLQQVFAVLKKNECLPAFEAAPFYQWALNWDEPEKLAPLPAPSFSPPNKVRPRKLPVTAIETLQKDPYSSYARQILKLRPMELLDRQPDARDWGNAAHKILENFFKENGFKNSNPAVFFDTVSASVLKDYPLSTAQAKAWNGKLDAIRDWLLANETGEAETIQTENTLSYSLPLNDGTVFEIFGRADRTDNLSDTIYITDYKTGTPPSETKIKNGSAPQLPLLGLLAQQLDPAKNIALRYIKLNGKLANPAEIKEFKNPEELIDLNKAHLQELLTAFYMQDAPYQAKALQGESHDNYRHLKRVAEWAALDDEDSEDTE